MTSKIKEVFRNAKNKPRHQGLYGRPWRYAEGAGRQDGYIRMDNLYETEGRTVAEGKEEWLNHIDAISAEINQTFAEEVLDTPEDVNEETEGAADVSVCAQFEIGDRVKIPAKAETIGIVTDIWSGMAQDKTLYEVTHESNGHKGLYAEEQLEPAPIPTYYSFEAHIDGNVAVVTMNATQGEKTWVYARGHAHILHDGEVGMAQAVSYAARRMFEALDKQQENKIYLKGAN